MVPIIWGSFLPNTSFFNWLFGILNVLVAPKNREPYTAPTLPVCQDALAYSCCNSRHPYIINFKILWCSEKRNFHRSKGVTMASKNVKNCVTPFLDGSIGRFSEPITKTGKLNEPGGQSIWCRAGRAGLLNPLHVLRETFRRWSARPRSCSEQRISPSRLRMEPPSF